MEIFIGLLLLLLFLLALQWLSVTAKFSKMIHKEMLALKESNKISMEAILFELKLLNKQIKDKSS